MKQYIKGDLISPVAISLENGGVIINPTPSDYLANGFVETEVPDAITVDAQEIVEQEKTYEELVEEYIREKYSVSAELAILRQEEAKHDEYQEYYEYCESCKARARQKINI